jgi:Endoribonuclease L-PSP
MIFVSANVAADAAGKTVAPGDIKGQTRQVLADIEKVLAEAGATRDDIVKITTFLADLSGLRRGTRNIGAAPLAAPSDKAPDRSAPRHRLGMPVGEPRVWQRWPRPGGPGLSPVWKEPRGSTHTSVIPPKNSSRVYVQNLRLATRRKRRLAEADQPTPRRGVIKYP